MAYNLRGVCSGLDRLLRRKMGDGTERVGLRVGRLLRLCFEGVLVVVLMMLGELVLVELSSSETVVPNQPRFVWLEIGSES